MVIRYCRSTRHRSWRFLCKGYIPSTEAQFSQMRQCTSNEESASSVIPAVAGWIVAARKTPIRRDL